MIIKKLITLCLVCFLLLSCAKKPAVRPPEPVEPYEGPVNVEVLKDFLVFSTMKAVQSEVDVKVLRGEKKMGKSRGVFLFEAPGSMRLRLFGPFGATVMDMVVASETMQVYIPRSNILYEGKSPTFGLPSGAAFSMEKAVEGYVLHAFRPKGDGLELVGRYYFDPVTLRNTGMTAFREGMRFMEADFGEFSGSAPMFIRMSFFNGFVMEMSLREPEFGEEARGDYFMPISHGGKRVLPLQSLLHGPLR
jgi:hypothetical protein